MQQLISDLLRFSRHSVGKGDFVHTNLSSVIIEAMKELELKIQHVDARITIDEMPSTLVIPTLIQQVFHNLIANAIKFCKKGVAPEVHIYARHEAPLVPLNGNSEQLYYNIYVKDNGIGFEAKYLDDIFIPFKRLHSYHEIEGTGIGLSICKKIMEQHNGFITATSVLNDGSTFIIGIPEKQVSLA
jgi:light-regulated signal transduction histidine kinase (bacteriophytochrome)